MTYQNLNRPASTARQTLVESSRTPFAPSAEVRPVVAVMDGRKRNDEIPATAWQRALEAGDGSIAVYFELAADHEWWLAYDPDGEYPDELDGPYQRWTTYPSGGWDHVTLPAGILDANLEDVYGECDRDRECEVYRSRVVLLEDAPGFVRREVGGRE